MNKATDPWARNEVGIFDINFETGEGYWSYELRRILGVRHDTPPEFHLLLQRIHPDDRRAFARSAMEPFRPDCPRHSSREFRVVHDDGHVRWLSMDRRTILRDENSDEVVRIVGFVVEIEGPSGLLCAA